jgi:nucleoside-diphosphate-sugar epimerase
MNMEASNEQRAPVYTILGAGGVIAKELSRELVAHGKHVRLVGRNPQPIENITDLLPADLTNYAQTLEAVKGSSIVFLCAGLTYSHKVWAVSWPLIMDNVINACKQVQARLIFFDNVYMYGLVKGKMTEDTPYNPCSKKGEIRARIATKLMDEVKAGNLNASIARAADFYGPGASTTGILNMLVIDKLIKGDRAMWLGNDQVTHSFTFTPDAGKALLLLAEHQETDNQIWHLPTTNPAPTGKEYVDLIAAQLGVKPKYMVMGGMMMKIAGLFNAQIREIHEMLYQNNYPYIFDSTKFDQHFSYTPYSYEKGIQLTLEARK